MDRNVVFASVIIVFVLVSLGGRVPIKHFYVSFGTLVLIFALYSFSYQGNKTMELFSGAIDDFVSFPKTATSSIRTKFDLLIAAVRHSMSTGNAESTVVDDTAFSCKKDPEFCKDGKIDKEKVQAHVNEIVPIVTMFQYMGVTPPLDRFIVKINSYSEDSKKDLTKE